MSTTTSAAGAAAADDTPTPSDRDLVYAALLSPDLSAARPFERHDARGAVVFALGESLRARRRRAGDLRAVRGRVAGHDGDEAAPLLRSALRAVADDGATGAGAPDHPGADGCAVATVGKARSTLGHRTRAVGGA